MLANTAAPSHVPPELVQEYDFFDMHGETDVYQHFRKLHDGPDIFYSTSHGGHWVLTRYEDMATVLDDPVRFSSRHQTLPKNPIVIPLLEFDGPLHHDFRKLLGPFFTPMSIKNLEKISRDLTNSLMDQFIDDGECDFVTAFSQRMPIMILMSLMDLPSVDTPYLLKISEDIVRSGKPELQEAAFGRVFEYMATKVIPMRRREPGNDIFSAVIKGQVQGRPVTDEELMGLGGLLVAAGLDTVANMLGYVTLFLAEHVEHRRLLVQEPARINDALEEMMRRHHLANIARVAMVDTVLNGVSIKAGDCILVPLSAAGLDERRFADPLKVDFDRADKKSLVFGRGPHQCIGAFLARTELRVFVKEWLRRIPEFSVKPGEQPRSAPGKGNSMLYLPLVWPVPRKTDVGEAAAHAVEAPSR